MNVDECSQRLRAGGSKFSFDTNALYDNKKLTALCSHVNLMNKKLASLGREPVYLAVCAVAHAEKLFDLKQRFRDTFDPSGLDKGLQNLGLRIEPFEVNHALETANRLGTFYPSAQDWHQAKKQLCLQCAGLDPSKHLEAKGTGKQCGATIDWLIAAHAQAEGCVLVTDDRGPEFKELERVKLDSLVASVQQFLSDPA